MKKKMFQQFATLLVVLLLLAPFGCRMKQSVSVAQDPEAVVAAQVESDSSASSPDDGLPFDPAVVKGQLHNGLSYLVMKNSEPKGRVSMHLAIRSGSLNETEEERGLAHFLEHMLFNGSENFPPGELIKYFQRIGMSFGGDANAHTSYDETVYDVVLQKGDTKSLQEGLLVMRDYAGGALLLPAEVERERGVILAEKRDRDSESYRNFVKSLAFEVPGMRMNDRHPIGVTETIEGATSKRLKGYYDAWYRPANMAIVVVGDMDPAETVALIKAQFHTLEARAPKRPPADPGVFEHEGIKGFYAHNPESGSTRVTLEVLTYGKKVPDTFEARRKKIIQEMASRILENRLDDLVGKEGTPYTSGGAGMGTFLTHVRYGVLSADCEPGRWKESLSVLDQTLRRALSYGFTPPEIARVKKEMINGLVQAEKKAPTRSSRRIASSLVKSFTQERDVISPADSRRLFEAVIAAVTEEELEVSLKSVWDVDHRLVMVEGNLKIEEAPEQTVLAAYKASAKIPVSAPVAKQAVSFPYLPASEEVGVIASSTVQGDLGVRVVTFENGLVLNLKQTDFKKGQVLYALDFGRGLSRERNLVPGLGPISSMVMNESGLGMLTREEAARALAGTNTSFGYSVGQGRFSISGRTTRDEVSSMVEILYTMVTDTQLKPESFDLALKRYEQGLDELGRTVDGVLERDGEAFLTGDVHRFGFPTASSLKEITFDDVKKLVLPSLETAPLEFSVVGDFDIEAFISLCGARLGALPKRVPVATTPVALLFPAGERLEHSVDSAINKAVVTVAWKTNDMQDIHRVRRLSILGGLFRERLRETIRETLGVAYSPSAWNNSSREYKGYGTLRAQITVAPESVPVVVDAVRTIAEGLVKSPASEDELRRVLDPLLNSITDYRRTNGYWLSSVMRGSSLYPEKFSWAETMMTDFTSITAADVQKLSKIYLKKGRDAVIVVTPDVAP